MTYSGVDQLRSEQHAVDVGVVCDVPPVLVGPLLKGLFGASLFGQFLLSAVVRDCFTSFEPPGIPVSTSH